MGAFQKQFYYQWIDSNLSGNHVFAVFNRISQDKAIRTFSEKDEEQFEIDKAKIRAELSSMRTSLDMITSGSALAILLREGEKKRKQKSIRSLLAEQRTTLRRRFYHGMTIKAAAELAGEKPDTVRKWESAGLNKLRQGREAARLRAFVDARTLFYGARGIHGVERVVIKREELAKEVFRFD